MLRTQNKSNENQIREIKALIRNTHKYRESNIQKKEHEALEKMYKTESEFLYDLNEMKEERSSGINFNKSSEQPLNNTIK